MLNFNKAADLLVKAFIILRGRSSVVTSSKALASGEINSELGLIEFDIICFPDPSIK